MAKLEGGLWKSGRRSTRGLELALRTIGRCQYCIPGLKRQDFGVPAVEATLRNGAHPLRESRIRVRLCVCNR
jgi:hypothetical protein